MKKPSVSQAQAKLSPAIDDRLARLVRKGIVRPARAAVPKEVLATPPSRAKNGASGVRALLDERRNGR